MMIRSSGKVVAVAARLSMLVLLTGAVACSFVPRLVPPGGRLVSEVKGISGRLRIYTMPPAQTPVLKDTVVVYVELKNHGQRSVRIRYEDIYLSADPAPRPGEGVVGVRRQAALPPGDVLRPSGLSSGHQQLFASLSPGILFGKEGGAGGPRRPDFVSDWQGTEGTLGGFAPTTRSTTSGPWHMRNDYNNGMQLSTEGWAYWGVPRPGSALSLFDILQSTLPDGMLLPGATAEGYLFYPRSAAPLTRNGLRWDVHGAIDDDHIETLSAPVQLERG